METNVAANKCWKNQCLKSQSLKVFNSNEFIPKRNHLHFIHMQRVVCNGNRFSTISLDECHCNYWNHKFDSLTLVQWNESPKSNTKKGSQISIRRTNKTHSQHLWTIFNTRYFTFNIRFMFSLSIRLHIFNDINYLCVLLWYNITRESLILCSNRCEIWSFLFYAKVFSYCFFFLFCSISVKMVKCVCNVVNSHTGVLNLLA